MTTTDRTLAVAAAEAGAAVVRSCYGSPLSRVDKGAGDFATSADLDAEAAIVNLLRAARPHDAVHGEERGQTGAGERTWLVDPLCGTLNFAVSTPLASVNVALRDHGRITAAAVADPFAGEVFWIDGGTARDGRGAPLVPSAASTLVDVNLDPPFPNRDVFLAARLLADDDFIARFRPRVISTTLAVAWVAAGRRAAYVTDGHLRDSVHFAAGIALCQAAGCVVTSLDGGPPHTGTEGLIVAADARTHAALRELIARQRDSRA
ncbi:inositol monophosphatase family protein [Catenuloplanes japonicus]|uniref:inositol monophosphatase family protein n=1 Tax=Catenuloplanes japonicus TaxID=33876 RepID=UPI000527A63A|nr:inositol monophosphatase family protein [Catenuloplanes japonicus]